MLIRLPKPNNHHRCNTHQKTKHRNHTLTNTRTPRMLFMMVMVTGAIMMMFVVVPASTMVMVPFKVPKHEIPSNHLDGGGVDEHSS
ncbi:hypothetical protein EST38_g10390 [Candolleomyces aberdarensis]|uniref:Transmembrane protein n=1 Tax=Candolleomyces aberdarensis TaxID=2316362 RepID=A0A4Q2D7H7_9AGAR|nr:hypothetical protein EST38_g10390 [Candolleomyces aberdarensis]